MKHTYQYCIEISYWMWKEPKMYDGFLSLKSRIVNEKDYNKLKEKLMSEHCSVSSQSASAIIKSLNYLGPVEN